MVSQRKRRLSFGLGLTVALALAVGLLPAVASAASTLTGETLTGISSSGNSGDCPSPTYSVNGSATGPYPGTLTETGTWTVDAIAFSATFTITSGATTITGSKSASSMSTPGLEGTLACRLPEIPELPSFANLTGVPYTATIHTPNGNFHDEGRSTVNVTITRSGAATLTETFTSSLAQPVLIAPTSKDQCKNGGWRNFPQFKNQGRCASFVERQRQT